MAKRPGEVEFLKGRFPSQFQEVGNSGLEIDPSNEAQRAEGQVSEMGADSHLGSETVPNEGKWRKIEEPIITTKRRPESGSL